jgi:hypothetical protein
MINARAMSVNMMNHLLQISAPERELRDLSVEARMDATESGLTVQGRTELVAPIDLTRRIPITVTMEGIAPTVAGVYPMRYLIQAHDQNGNPGIAEIDGALLYVCVIAEPMVRQKLWPNPVPREVSGIGNIDEGADLCVLEKVKCEEGTFQFEDGSITTYTSYRVRTFEPISGVYDGWILDNFRGPIERLSSPEVVALVPVRAPQDAGCTPE